MTATRDLTACPRSCVKRPFQKVPTTGRWSGAEREPPLVWLLKASREQVTETQLVLATTASPGVSSALTPATQLDTTKTRLRLTHRGAATDSGPPGQHIHSGPPAFRGGGGGGGLYITEIAIAFLSQSFFPLLPNQIIQFQLLKSFSFVCNGKVIIFRFVFL